MNICNMIFWYIDNQTIHSSVPVSFRPYSKISCHQREIRLYFLQKKKPDYSLRISFFCSYKNIFSSSEREVRLCFQTFQPSAEREIRPYFRDFLSPSEREIRSCFKVSCPFLKEKSYYTSNISCPLLKDISDYIVSTCTVPF